MSFYPTTAWNAAYQSGNQVTPPAARISEDELLKRYGSWKKIVSRAKHLNRNNWIAVGARNTLVDYIASNGGLRPIGGTELAREIWNNFTAGYVDWQLKNSWTDIQAQIVAGCFDGDILIRLVGVDGLPGIQTRVQLMDGGVVATPTDGSDDPTISLGVQYDSNGIETGYWVYKGGEGMQNSDEFEFVPRYNDKGHEVALLLRNPDPGMIRQSRGLPSTTAVIPQIEDVASLETSAVQGADVKSKLSVVVRTPDGTKFKKAASQVDSNKDPVGITGRNGTAATIGRLASGSIQTLPFDEGDMQVVSHSGNADLGTLFERTLKDIATGLGITYEILLSNFSGINFSAGKLSFDKFYRKLNRWEQSISKALDMVRRAVVFEGYLVAGVVPTRDDLKVTAWIGAGRPDPDPARSSTAEGNRLSAGTLLRAEIVMTRSGLPYDKHLEAMAQERQLEKQILGEELKTPETQPEENENGKSNPDQ